MEYLASFVTSYNRKGWYSETSRGVNCFDVFHGRHPAFWSHLQFVPTFFSNVTMDLVRNFIAFVATHHPPCEHFHSLFLHKIGNWGFFIPRLEPTLAFIFRCGEYLVSILFIAYVCQRYCYFFYSNGWSNVRIWIYRIFLSQITWNVTSMR